MKRMSFLVLASLSVFFATPVLARGVVVSDIALPAGFVVTAEVVDVESPSMIAFDDEGRMLIAENGSEPKITRIEENGAHTAVVRGVAFGDKLPLTAINVVDGRIVVSHGDTISALEPSGEFRTLGADDPARVEFIARLTEPAHPPSDAWGNVDDIIVAAPEASRVDRIDTDGSMEVLVENRIPSNAGGQGLDRPVHVMFAPDQSLYITDESGVIWKVEQGTNPSSPVAAGWTMFRILFGSFIAGSLTYLAMRGGDRAIPAWQGAWRGLVAAALSLVTSFIVAKAVFGMPWYTIGRVASTVFMGRAAVADMATWNSTAFALGTLTILAGGVFLGSLFTTLLRARKPSRVMLAGTFFGLSAWIIVQYLVLPLLWPVIAEKALPQFWMAILFILFGLALGFLTSRLVLAPRAKSPPRRRSLRRRSRYEVPIELRPRRIKSS